MSIIMIDFKNKRRVASLLDAHRKDDSEEKERKTERHAAFTGFVAGTLMAVAIAVGVQDMHDANHNWQAARNNNTEYSVTKTGSFRERYMQRNLLGTLNLEDSRYGVSFNWAGYEIDGSNGAFKGVSASFTVPTAMWDGNKAIDMWTGLGGSPSEGLIQAGVEVSGSKVFPWVEELPKAQSRISGIEISSGDSVSISIDSRNKSGIGNLWTISIVDNTTGKRFSETLDYKVGTKSAECIVESPRTDIRAGGPILNRMPDFGTVSFGSCVPVFTKLGVKDAESTMDRESDSVKVMRMYILRRDGRLATSMSGIGSRGSFDVNYIPGPESKRV